MQDVKDVAKDAKDDHKVEDREGCTHQLQPQEFHQEYHQMDKASSLIHTAGAGLHQAMAMTASHPRLLSVAERAIYI
ncbi:hypothetical protein MTO96_037598 [Rhipicephalus appendiculatus]